MTQTSDTPALSEKQEREAELTSIPSNEATSDELFEEFDLDDIEIIESKVFA